MAAFQKPNSRSQGGIDRLRALERHRPLAPVWADSLQHKWDHKPVLASKLVDDASSLDHWELKPVYGKRNVGRIALSKKRAFAGGTSLRFVSPTKLPVPLGEEGRYWEWQFLTRKFEREDFSAYNRISVEVFPEFKGHRKPCLLMILHNAGNVPDKYFRDGIHTVTLENGRWNKVVMEIPHLPHDGVTGVSLVYRLQGNELGAADEIAFDVDDLRFESVEADHFEGWNTQGAIAYCHSGYDLDAKKTALTSTVAGDEFEILDAATHRPVLRKRVGRTTSHAGTFTTFDFSEVKTPGEYRIVYGPLASRPFPIREDVWLPSVEKSLNLFFVERCGYAVPGVHGVCHQDWYTVSDGERRPLTGGWHDAGDLSQSHTNTAEATGILFRLARRYRTSNPRLSKRFVEEGLWGLRWLHQNRFEGGKIVDWTVIDHWTDNRIGGFDDVVAPSPKGRGGYFSVLANVEAARTLEPSDPKIAGECRRIALEDWGREAQGETRTDTEHLAMSVLAGARLYELAKRDDVLQRALADASRLLTLQQTEAMPWTLPLKGFFYRDAQREALFGFNHGFTVATPIAGLVELCRLFPDHADHAQWVRAIRLHAEYLKTIAKLTAPYDMVPANVYALSNDEAHNVQVRQGVKMDETHYLRMFPVWEQFRGNTPNVLSWGIGLAMADRVLHDPDARSVAQSQLEWLVGKNPFAQSLMYGEGHDFSPQYAVMTGDIVGALPVGILTSGDRDVPYWQASVFCNYKEVWGHCSIRWLTLLECLSD